MNLVDQDRECHARGRSLTRADRPVKQVSLVDTIRKRWPRSRKREDAMLTSIIGSLPIRLRDDSADHGQPELKRTVGVRVHV